MNEIEELEAAHTAAYYAYLDADRAIHAARDKSDRAIHTARDDARNRMFIAARAFDSAIDNEDKINLNLKRIIK